MTPMDGKITKVISKALAIISEESGIALEELADDSVLTDIGIDSLLSLMITSRLQEELALELDSTTFASLLNIKQLKAFLIESMDGNAIRDEKRGRSIESDLGRTDSGQDLRESPVAPREAISSNDKEVPPNSHQELNMEEVSDLNGNQFPRMMQIISDETGIAITKFADDTVFSDVGIDSLLSLMISSRFRDELNLDFSVEDQLFNICPTVRDLASYFAPAKVERPGTPSTDSISSTTESSIRDGENEMTTDSGTLEHGTDTPCSSNDESGEIKRGLMTTRSATLMILQGLPWKASKTLMLFPDGAGSATSYVSVPKIHPDLAVVCLNCPYVRNPQEMMTVAFDELMKSYLKEVKRRQPHGPYNLGGWSAGGILAYRAAQILIDEGESVDNLVLIDSPVPTKGLDRLPQYFYDHCNSIGLFGKTAQGSIPVNLNNLFAHFNATIEVLHRYRARRLPAKHGLKTVSIIWATESVMDGIKFPKLEPRPDDTEGMKFLTEKRIDFSAAGWETLFPGVSVDVRRIDGAHHFSMMVSP